MVWLVLVCRVAVMIPHKQAVAFQRGCAVPGPWPRLARCDGQASRRYTIDSARRELRSHSALPSPPVLGSRNASHRYFLCSRMSRQLISVRLSTASDGRVSARRW
ncbi:hypothetical protein V8C34DRAFT_270519 [Trichoderma compactum]